jgi:GTP-binding protein
MSVLLTARFHTTVVSPSQLPRAGLPEIAFAGRSNSGKSSAINAICQRRRLAFASRTPGRTQALNFFAIGPQDDPRAFLVDTPGYGYASAPQAVRGAWDALAGRYLRERAALRAVVLTVDVRRLFTDLDRRMLDWLAPALPLLVLLTKSDKLGFAQRQAARRAALAQLRGLRPGAGANVLLFSTTARAGIEQARDAIEALLDARAAAQGPAGRAGGHPVEV